MSRNAEIELDFGDGTYTFRLAWGELAKLQEACDAGPYVIFKRLSEGNWLLNDIRETIRLGLVGGGMTPVEALKIVREYVEARPALESVLFAQEVLSAALIGAPEESVGESQAARGAETIHSQTGKSDLPRSTETAPS